MWVIDLLLVAHRDTGFVMCCSLCRQAKNAHIPLLQEHDQTGQLIQV
jgi:hypothetical protein